MAMNFISYIKSTGQITGLYEKKEFVISQNEEWYVIKPDENIENPDDYEIQGGVLLKKSQEDIDSRLEKISKKKFRETIKKLLNESDWTRLDDAKITPRKKQEFGDWRKALVDLDIENTDTIKNPPQIPDRPSEK